MKYWKCPKCKGVAKSDEPLIMRVCNGCQVEMDLMEGDE